MTVSLASVSVNKYVEIVDLNCGKSCYSKLKDLGILKGQIYRIMSAGKDGFCILFKDGNRIGLGCKMAFKIMVKEVS